MSITTTQTVLAITVMSLIKVKNAVCATCTELSLHTFVNVLLA